MTIGSGNSSDAWANSASPRGAASRDRRHVGGSSSALVSLNEAERTEAELRQEILMLQRRVTTLAALLRLALVLGPRGQRRFTRERLLDGPDKARLLRAIEGPARPSRCEGSCGFCICRRAGVTPGAAGSPNEVCWAARRARLWAEPW